MQSKYWQPSSKTWLGGVFLIILGILMWTANNYVPSLLPLVEFLQGMPVVPSGSDGPALVMAGYFAITMRAAM